MGGAKGAGMAQAQNSINTVTLNVTGLRFSTFTFRLVWHYLLS